MVNAPILTLPIKSLADGSVPSKLLNVESPVSVMSSEECAATAPPSNQSAAGSVVESESAEGEASPGRSEVDTPCVLYAATPSHLEDSFWLSGHCVGCDAFFPRIEPMQDSLLHTETTLVGLAVDSTFVAPAEFTGLGGFPWVSTEMMQNAASPGQMTEVCPLQQTHFQAQMLDAHTNSMMPPISSPPPPMWFIDQADVNANPYCVTLEMDSIMSKPIDSEDSFPIPNTTCGTAPPQAAPCVPNTSSCDMVPPQAAPYAPDSYGSSEEHARVTCSEASDEAALPSQELLPARDGNVDAPLDVLPSEGSKLHDEGKCNPCAWFWKSSGCQNAIECRYCHLCPKEEMKNRKKAKILALRAASSASDKLQSAEA